MDNKMFKHEDYKINIKLVLSALWTSEMFLYIYGDYFELYVPGKVEGLLSGENLLNTPHKLFLATFILVLPALMIFLSMMLASVSNRILNISIALLLTIFTGIAGISSLNEWKMFYVMLSFLETLISIVIIWKAWKWPKNSDQAV